MNEAVSPKELAARTVRDHYLNVWPTILEPWTEYLVAARKSFDGDIDSMIILAVIGQMTMARYGDLQKDGRVVGYDDLVCPEMRSALSKPINAESVSLYTGIPRETVRRKVGRLIEKGWVAKDDKGMLTATHAASRDLAALGHQLFALIGLIYSVMSQTLETDPRVPVA